MATPDSSENNAIPPTYFASPERATPEEIAQAIRKISGSPLLDAALQSLGGWVCVINQFRQILAINETFLKGIGVHDPAEALGLRPGEAIRCIHAQDHPAGCGTSQFCTTCGAAIAIVAAQEQDQPQQMECLLTSEIDGVRIEREFMVNCGPFHLDNEKLVLICMRDISDEKRRASLERAFLHDVSGVLSALAVASDRLKAPSAATPENVQIIQEATALLVREVRLQRLLIQDNPQHYPVELTTTAISSLLGQLKDLMESHPSAYMQHLAVQFPAGGLAIETDVGLLRRVPSNMIINAFEAGQPGDEVRMAARAVENDTLEFSVWNHQPIPEPVQLRIFQRHFTTKTGSGRGLGTYIMKLLGEQILGGQVSFTSTPQTGTCFTIRLPRTYKPT